MGNPKPPFDEVLALLEQLKKDVPVGRLVELGDNPIILDTLENHLEKLHQSLDKLKDFYASKPLKESNPYYQAIGVTHKAQKFVREIHNKEAKKENNDTIRNYLRELEGIFSALSGTQIASTSEGNTKENVHPLLPTKQDSVIEIKPAPPSVVLTSVNSVRPQQRAKIIIGWLGTLVTIPKPIGRFVLDIIGRHEAAESSSTIMGWLIVILLILGFKGIIQIEAVTNFFREIWNLVK